MCDAREAENTQRLDKLPQEVWGKILDHLDENDLFPVALSCRFFRQKQKELVAQTRQKENGSKRGKPRLTLRTNLQRKLWDEEPASADYLRFCSKEKVPSYVDRQTGCLITGTCSITYLAAFHGYLPLLQKLLADSEILCDSYITEMAGESSTSQSLLLLLFCCGF